MRGFELFSGNVEICMEANTPYVLNMISPDGVAIEGEVSFIVTGGVRIVATQPYYIQVNARQSLTGGYGPVAPDKDIYVMNEAGDAFVECSLPVNPFEAYLQSQIASSSSIPFILYIPVSGVQLSKTAVSLEEGKTVGLSAVVFPENATNKNLIWCSGDNTIATVSSGLQSHSNWP